MEPLCCSVADAAKSVGVCRATIYNWMREGRLSTSRVGRRRLVRVESLRALVEAA
jgi:excisionase family DNA binding protein